MGRVVDEPDAQLVSLGASQSRAGDTSVECPCREPDAWCDLDLLVLGQDCPLAPGPPVGSHRDRAGIELAEDRGGIEAVGDGVDAGPRPERRSVHARVSGGDRPGTV